MIGVVAMARPQAENMDITQILTTAGVGGGVGILASMVMDWAKRSRSGEITAAVFQERIDGLKKELATSKEDSAGDMETIVRELKVFSEMVVRLQSSQDVVNAVTAKALDSIAKKTESYDHMLSEIRTTQGMLGELLREIKAK